jgi:hypothetical protein
LQAAVAAGRDADLRAPLEVLDAATLPNDEAVVPERAVGRAGEDAILDLPIRVAAGPARKVFAIEHRDEPVGRRLGESILRQNQTKQGDKKG